MGVLMTTFRFTCEKNGELLEKGHRIIVLNGPVVDPLRNYLDDRAYSRVSSDSAMPLRNCAVLLYF